MNRVTSFSGRILTSFANLQCWEDEGTLCLNDEASVMTYKYLERDTGFPKDTLRPEVIRLRNERLIELVTAFDRDYEFRAGSGYFLTEKGRALCQKLGLSDELAAKEMTTLKDLT